MAEPIQPLYEAYIASGNEAIAAKAASDAADARHAASKVALFDRWPDGETFATSPDPSNSVPMKRVGDKLEPVTFHFIGHPYPPEGV